MEGRMSKLNPQPPRQRPPVGAAFAPDLGARSFTGPGATSWVCTTQNRFWRAMPSPAVTTGAGQADVEILTNAPLQRIEGFGACFNELGWTALSALSADRRDQVLRELFAPGMGGNFTLCRMPIGSNDYSRDWYSYDEQPDDFGLESFSIANDRETLIPFIQAAQRHQQGLGLWASPWSPPSWMKTNNGYAAFREGGDGVDLFIQEERYFESYAEYFVRFIEAYRAEGIEVAMVMPQNEFSSAQVFPSCTWSADGLARLIRHLGPRLDLMGVHLFLGTIERGNPALVEAILDSPGTARFIKGAGFQWEGKAAIGEIHARRPGLVLYQTEQECGDGKNTWVSARYAWSLMRHYLSNGASAYMYWNIALPPEGESHWGWRQNSLVTVKAKTGEVIWNPDYYPLKHISHFVGAGARRLTVMGRHTNVLAFETPDRKVVVVVHNPEAEARRTVFKLGGRRMAVDLPADSFNTLVL
jgi:glucosylceramidase